MMPQSCFYHLPESHKSHYGNDVPFEVPKGWIRCKLGDVCAFENGFAFSSNNYTLSGTPLIRISNITSENSVTLDNCVYVQSNVDDRFIVSEGDLLIALSGATTGKMGVYTFSDKAYLNQRVGNLKVFDKTSVLPDYRNVFMMSRSEMILNLAYGGAQPNISGTVICDFDFPLPPIAEQRRIVTEVNRYFSIIDFIETEISDLKDSVKKAKSKVMELALNGKLTSDTSHYGKNEETFSGAALGDVCKLCDGEKIAGKDYTNLDVKYLRGTKSGDMLHSGRFVPAGSLMILVDGENSGEVFTTPIDGYQGSTFKILDFNAKYCKEFILLLIQSNRKSLRENKVGSAIPHLNKKMFKEIVVPPFSYNEQCEIAQTVKDYFCVLDSIVG